MLRFAYVNVFLLCISLVKSQLGESFKSNWVPVNYTERPIQSRSFIQTTENIWKQAQSTQNIDLIKEEAIKVVTPPQIHRRKGITFHFSTPNINEDIDFSPFDYINKPEFKKTTETPFLDKASELPELVEFNENEAIVSTASPINVKLNTTEDLKLSELKIDIKFNKSEDLKLPNNMKSNTTTLSKLFEIPTTLKLHTSKDSQVSESPKNIRFNTSEYSKVSVSPKNIRFNREDFTRLSETERINAKEVSESSQLRKDVKLITSEVLSGSVSEAHRRKSKQIENHDFVNNIENLGENTTEDYVKAAETSRYLDVTGKKYEVTESTATTEAKDETTITLNKGYIYKQPLINPIGLTPARNAITSKLFDNLSKYNIQVNDFLNNYRASKARVLNHDRMFKSILRSPIPAVVSIPFRYNSLNHLPVNPLLAAFLSNYGYYLQGSFGRPNNYNNLYGYSASNNIHNNKPFGSYKIYSDTDANQ